MCAQGTLREAEQKMTTEDETSARDLSAEQLLQFIQDWEIYKLRQIRVETCHRTLGAFSDPERSHDRSKDKLTLQ